MMENEKKGESPLYLPKNIRQIGEMDKYHKIYIEDYVITYLKQVAMEQEMGSKVLALFGESKRDAQTTYYFIYGAISSDKNRLEEGAPLFGEEEKDLIKEKKREFFPAYKMLGWALLENEFNRVSDDGVWKNGSGEFSKEEKLFLRIDTANGNETRKIFYNGTEKNISGHAIFYDKNEAMQNYLIVWHKEHSENSTERVKDTAARKFRTIIEEKEHNSYQQKAMSFFYLASTVLMIVLCVTGITMLNHYEKMRDMETAISHLVQAMDQNNKEQQEMRAAEVQTAEMQTTEMQTAEEQTTKIQTEEKQTTEAEVEMVRTEYEAYIVQKGDTLVSISSQFYQTTQRVQEICMLNQIENPDSIKAGQKILLP